MPSPIYSSDLGPTGKFPDGKSTEHDQGEVLFAVGYHEGTVYVDFGVASVGLEPGKALELAASLQRSAHQATGSRTQ